MIQETVEKMRALQELLIEKFEIEEEVLQLPRLLDTKREMLERLQYSHKEKVFKQEELHKQIQQFRMSLENAEQQREEFEKRISVIETQREYEALDKEIQNVVLQEQRLRKDLLRLEKELGEIEQGLEQDQRIIDEQSEELFEESKRVDTEAVEHNSRLGEIKNEEQEITKGIDEELLFKFERIIRSKGGKGIVPIRGAVCTGCHMVLPNQFVNNVRKADKILFCPYCSKIVYFIAETSEAQFFEEETEGLIDLVDYDVGDFDESVDIEIDEELLEDDDTASDDAVLNDSDSELSDDELGDDEEKIDDLSGEGELDDDHAEASASDEFDAEEDDIAEDYDIED